jgi:hypothetical protein
MNIDFDKIKEDLILRNIDDGGNDGIVVIPRINGKYTAISYNSLGRAIFIDHGRNVIGFYERNHDGTITGMFDLGTAKPKIISTEDELSETIDTLLNELEVVAVQHKKLKIALTAIASLALAVTPVLILML